MLLRAAARPIAHSGRGLRRFTIDVQTSTGFNIETGVGVPPLPADEIAYAQPSRSGEAFGQNRLEQWLDAVGRPYPPPPVGAGT